MEHVDIKKRISSNFRTVSVSQDDKIWVLSFKPQENFSSLGQLFQSITVKHESVKFLG